MKVLILISAFILSVFYDESYGLQVITSLERDSKNSNFFIRSGIELGVVYLNNFEMINIKGSEKTYDISLVYNDDRDYLLYDSIKKHHPLVKIYELNQVTSKEYVIIDTLLTANLEDTLRFNYSQKRNNSFVIYNEGFKPKNYRIEKKR